MSDDLGWIREQQSEGGDGDPDGAVAWYTCGARRGCERPSVESLDMAMNTRMGICQQECSSQS
jgi:hypothetical protein